jgi:hypothetical protein
MPHGRSSSRCRGDRRDHRCPLPIPHARPFARFGNIIPLALGFLLLIAAIALDRRARYRAI